MEYQPLVTNSSSKSPHYLTRCFQHALCVLAFNQNGTRYYCLLSAWLLGTFVLFSVFPNGTTPGGEPSPIHWFSSFALVALLDLLLFSKKQASWNNLHYCLANREFERALARLEEIAPRRKICPCLSSQEFSVIRATILMCQGSFESARKELQQARKAGLDQRSYLLKLLEIERQAKSFDSALGILNQLRFQDEKEERVLVEEALVYLYQRTNYKKAQQLLEQVLLLPKDEALVDMPSLLIAETLMAVTHLFSGRADEGLHILEQSLVGIKAASHLDGNMAYIYSYVILERARYFALHGQRKAALQDLENVEQLLPHQSLIEMTDEIRQELRTRFGHNYQRPSNGLSASVQFELD